jgi:peptidoglycan LD-endopeptidase LytH
MTPGEANGVQQAMSALQARRSPLASVLRRVVSLAVAIALTSCNARDALDRLRPPAPTPHERYAEALRDARLDSTAMGREWLAAGDSAIRAPLAATLPAHEAGVYARSEARAVAYRFELREGQRLQVSVETADRAARLFVDLFEITGDSTRPFAHRRTADSVSAGDSGSVRLGLQYEARESGAYVLRVQPELLRGGKFDLTLRTEPILAFPVKGGTNRSVQSYFGAVRDGGRRDHHGIDIFAARGTPVLAAANGVVRSIAPNNLGGNVVWLSDTDRGQTLYYAHLDRHAVVAGQPVQVGEVLGYVGNTGNARTTAPHLHFGIYRRGRGPIDPLPYVRMTTATAPTIGSDPGRLGSLAVFSAPVTEVRHGPWPESALLRRVPRDTPARLMGASGAWLRVQLEDGSAGYVTVRSVRVASAADPRELQS